MELLQPSMDASRRLPIIYHTGCGPLELYVGFEMMQPTRGLSQMSRSIKTTPLIVCRHHLANVCHMQEECKELHTIQKVSMSIMGTFDVDCFCARCFKIKGTRRSLLQCMWACPMRSSARPVKPQPTRLCLSSFLRFFVSSFRFKGQARMVECRRSDHRHGSVVRDIVLGWPSTDAIRNKHQEHLS
jgi:hypothetical protein